MSAHADLPDAGFEDVDLARATVRRLRLRTGLRAAQKSLSGCLDIVEESFEPMGRKCAPIADHAVGLTGRDKRSVIDDASVLPADRHAEREQELLLGVDLLLQLMDQLAVGLRHGLFSLATAEERKRTADAAHRLSGGAE